MQNTDFNGYPVRDPSIINTLKPDAVFIAVSDMYLNEITEELTLILDKDIELLTY